jgi:hypothetical protein
LISFTTTSGTVATRFSPGKVSRGTPINNDIPFSLETMCACEPVPNHAGGQASPGTAAMLPQTGPLRLTWIMVVALP